MVHPAPLKSKAPQPNSSIILKSGKFPGDAAKLIDLNQQTPETIILLFLNYYLIQKNKIGSRTTYKAKQGARSQWVYRGEQGEHMGEHVLANTSRSKTPLPWTVTVLNPHCYSDPPCSMKCVQRI